MILPLFSKWSFPGVISFVIIISSGFISCAQQPPDPQQEIEVLKNKYHFRHPTVHEFPDSLAKGLFIPFFEDGKYYIANYYGKRLSGKSWDKVYPIMHSPYFYGQENGITQLYRYPEYLIIPHHIDIGPISKPPLQIEKNLKSDGIYSIRVDTLIQPTKGAIKKYFDKRVEVKFYFGPDQITTLTECYFDPGSYSINSYPFYRKPSYREEYLQKHVVVFTLNLGFNILDLNGRRIFKEDFWNILKLNDNYIIAIDSIGKRAVASTATGYISEYVFDSISLLRGCDSTFLAGIIKSDSIQ